MEPPAFYFKQNQNNYWLTVGAISEGDRFTHTVNTTLQALHQLKHLNSSPRLLLAETDPVLFLARFLAACIADCPIFLANPHWGLQEKQHVLELVHPEMIWASSDWHQLWAGLAQQLPQQEQKSPQQGWILMPTGGSSGQIRFVIHTWQTLMSAVAGFGQYFAVEQVHSYCCLPLHHVSGLMQFLRSFMSGGQLAVLSWKALTASDREPNVFPPVRPQSFISLVPTQLQRLLQQPYLVDWLLQFQTVLLGGAPAWPGLLQPARQLGIRLAPTYGMTETAAQIATLKPDDFLQGCTSCGQLLPHAQVQAGIASAAPKAEVLQIQATSLGLGYYPLSADQQGFEQIGAIRQFCTDDRGYIDVHSHLHVIGRESRKIITGGENIFPEAVEAAIQSTGLVQDVYVFGLPDSEWGEGVAAAYVPSGAEVDVEQRLRAILKQQLTPYSCPKYWLKLSVLPRNAQGKLAKDRILKLFQI